MDCGGIVDNPGGAITMMHMAQEGFLKHYDCIWIIKPPRNYFHLKTHLYLKITQFAEFGKCTIINEPYTYTYEKLGPK